MSAPVRPTPADPGPTTPSGADRIVDTAAQSVPIEEPHRLAETPLPTPVQRVAVERQPAPTDSPDESVEPAQLDAPLIPMPVAPTPAGTTPTGGAVNATPAVPVGLDPARGASAPLADPTESVSRARPADPAEPPMTLRSAGPPTVQRSVGLLSQRMLTPLLTPATTIALARSTQRMAAPQDSAAIARSAAPVTMLPPVIDLPQAPRADHFRPATVIPSTTATSAPHHPLQRSVAGPLSAHRPARSAASAPVQRAVDVPEMEVTPDAGTEPTTPVPEPTAGTPASPQTSPQPAAATSSGGTGAAGPGANPSPHELDKLAGRLIEPLTRRIKAEMLIDRERRGLRSDPR